MRDEQQAQDIRQFGENRRYLPGHKLSERINPTTDLAEAAKDRELIIVTVPSGSFRSVCQSLKPHVSPSDMIVSGTKGIEGDGFVLMSQIIAAETGALAVGAISGPNLAEEMAQGHTRARLLPATMKNFEPAPNVYCIAKLLGCTPVTTVSALSWRAR